MYFVQPHVKKPHQEFLLSFLILKAPQRITVVRVRKGKHNGFFSLLLLLLRVPPWREGRRRGGGRRRESSRRRLLRLRKWYSFLPPPTTPCKGSMTEKKERKERGKTERGKRKERERERDGFLIQPEGRKERKKGLPLVISYFLLGGSKPKRWKEEMEATSSSARQESLIRMQQVVERPLHTEIAT